MELYINNIQVDTLGTPIAQTFHISDIGDIAGRKLSFTSKIKLPKSSHNVQVFDMLGIASNTSRVHRDKLRARLSFNSINTIKGYAQLQSIDEYYNVVLFADSFSLIKHLENKTLKDLDYSDINHELTLSNILNSQANQSGYTHALIDFGGCVEDGALRMDKNVGAIYVHTLWDKIFTGIPYSGNIFKSLLFRALAITPTKGIDFDMSVSIPNDLIYSETCIDLGGEGTWGEGIWEDDEEYRFAFQFPHTNSVHFVSQRDTLISKRVGLYHFYLDELIYYASSLDSRNSTVGNLMCELQFIVNEKVYCVNGISVDIYLNINDKIRIEAVAHRNSPAPHLTYQNRGRLTISDACEMHSNHLDYADLMPDVPIIELVKDVMMRFGLVVQYQQGAYHFLMIKELFHNTNTAEDWSDKFTQIVLQKPFNTYAQKNYLKYKGEELGDPIIIDNKNLKEKKDLFTSPFEVSTRSAILDYVAIHQASIYERQEEGLKPKQGQPHLFLLHRTGCKPPLRLKGITNSVSYQQPLMAACHSDFSNFIYNYYTELKATVEKGFIITALMQLTPLDIHRLDFFKLKYIKQLGGYFYLNKVSNYTNGRLTKVELVSTFPLQVNNNILSPTADTTGITADNNTLTADTL